jgi:mono/diheme cytochrome c family protein
MDARILLVSLLTLTGSGTGWSKPMSYVLPNEIATFRTGPGADVTQNNCVTCHSADYINSQPPKMGASFWDAEVKKMVKNYGAQIDEKDAKEISDYLARTY